MDEAAPITWLVAKINAIVSAGASATASTLAGTIMPLVAAGFAIYMMLIVLNYMRGAEDNFVGDFIYRVIGFSIVLGIGLNAGNYVSIVMPIVTGIGSDIAAAVSGGSANENSLDSLCLKYLGIISRAFSDIGLLEGVVDPLIYVSTGFKVFIIFVTLVPFLVSATIMLIIADVGVTIVAMLGPIYLACLLFPATRQYFSSWLNTVFSYALVPLIVAVISLISVNISDAMIPASATLARVSFFSVFLAGVGNLVLLLLIKQVSAIASSLSAGGINMGGGGGLGSAASAVRNAARGTSQDIKGGMAAAKGAASAYKAISNKLAGKGGGIKPG